MRCVLLMLLVLSTSTIPAAAQNVAAGDAQAPDAPTPAPERRMPTDPTDSLSSGGAKLTVALYEAYDQVMELGRILATSPADPSPVQQGDAPYTGGTATLSYARNGRYSTFGTTGNASTSYYPHQDQLLTSASGGVAGSTRVGRRGQWSGSGALSYAPYYNFDMFPFVGNSFGGSSLLQESAPVLDHAVADTPISRLNAATSFSQQLTDRSSFTADYSLGRSISDEANIRLTDQSAGARFSHQATRTLGYHAGYHFGTGRYGTTDTLVRTHNIDVGLDFQRSLSFSRRTTFSFSTGSSILSSPSPAGASAASHTEFRVLGSADLVHTMGRTWSARASYRRDWQLVDGSFQPLFYDAVTVGTGGTLNRRTSVGVNASYLFGSTNDALNIGHETSYAGAAFLRVAASRALSFYADYRYYRYDLTDVVLASALPRRFRRNGVRGGIVLTFPRAR